MERLAMEYYDPKPREFVDDDEDGVEVVKFARQGMPIVEIRTMIFAEVLGGALSGRHQVRQGLRGLIIPKYELTKRVNSSIELKEKVGRRLTVQST
ncbi:hypothetical protein Bca52824_016419 [Brassica carinata]|uniref:Uncharacterized protein n=1 Tax=Brassica carinata TaxID=52824 RepID=A0A8X7W4E5_BRACI|nr:hypothetical protein Bca52824_016419 [Brassica carinata]